eukprot:4716220-Lingulodinium_polyedra.AAC.1
MARPPVGGGGTTPVTAGNGALLRRASRVRAAINHDVLRPDRPATAAPGKTVALCAGRVPD